MSFLVNPYLYAATCADADGAAFLSAAGITDPTITSAICTLVTTMKANGTWAKMNAIYPMVGGTGTTHKFNLKNPADTNAAFRLSFVGGWTHSANGALPNGVNSYADSFLNASTLLTKTNTHLSVYLRTDLNTGLFPIDIGSSTDSNLGTNNTILITRYTNKSFNAIAQNGSFQPASLDSRGLWNITTNGSTTGVYYRNGTQYGTSTTAQNSFANVSLYIGAVNNNGIPSNYSNKEFAFASIGSGFTPTEAAALYTSVQAFQTTLSRQV
jgi:hypothetical protein